MDLVIGLFFLTLMEIVLGIDNIVFITILSGKLPAEQQPLARRLGLIFALLTRLVLLFTLSFVVHNLQDPLFELTSLGLPEAVISKLSGAESFGGHGSGPAFELPAEVVQYRFEQANGVSWRDIVLFLGGLFLLAKSVYEIHNEIATHGEKTVKSSSKAFIAVLVQIALLDMVFSLDSVITAVGMVEQVWIMVTSIILAILVMLIFAEPTSRFVNRHPTLKVLALSFLILIGVMLMAESAGSHLDKGYVYFAMFFALIVEIINMRIRRKGENPNNG
jgi:predicted tellurium resistance membrane protein TerC